MKENKLTSLLKVFSPKQFKQLNEFVISPFFNKNGAIVRFVQYLSTLMPEWEEEKLSEEVISAHIFPNEPFDRMKVMRLRSETFQIVEKYIVHAQVEQEENRYNVVLLDFYTQHYLDKHYFQTLKSLQQEQEAQVLQNADYYYQNFLLAQSLSGYLTYKHIRNNDGNIQTPNDNLDVFYLSRKLENYCQMLNHSAVVAVEFQYSLWDEILNYIDKNEHIRNIPAIKMHYDILNMLRFPQDISYFEVGFETLNKSAHFFPIRELKNFYNYFVNYCTAKMNQGLPGFMEKVFHLSQILIEKEFIYDWAGNVSVVFFRNTVVIALRLHKIEWAQHFIETYKDKLQEGSRENVYKYCLALLKFTQKSYWEVLGLLHSIENYIDSYFDFSSRRLLIQTYYELNETELVYVNINSFRVFIHRNKTVSEKHKVSNRNFVNLLSKILEVDNKNAAACQKLRQKIATTQILAERNWLVEKIGG
jgi:hypothetical protein